MAALTLTITSPTTGILNDGMAEHPITGPDLAFVRNEVMAIGASLAAQTGEETLLTVYENGQTFHVGIAADGSRNLNPQLHVAQPQVTPAVPVTSHAEPAPLPHENTLPAAFEIPSMRIPDANPFIHEVPQQYTPQPSSPQPPQFMFDENDPEWQAEKSAPAVTGARGNLNSLFKAKLPPTQAELSHRRHAFIEREVLKEEERSREAYEQEIRWKRKAERERAEQEKAHAERAAIQTNFQGTRTILIANPKGGARKTTTTYLLAATMGIIRGGSVIAWDANETMGTLGERALQDLHTRTVVDLLEDAAPSFNSVESSRVGTLDAFVRPQGDSHFDVLASDEDPTRQDIVDDKGFETVHEILSRFYRMIFIDTGNNIRAAHFRSALDSADQLVIPVAASRDSAKVATQMMRAFEATGHGDLVKRAVVLLHDLEPENSADDAYLEVVSTIAHHLEPQVAAVIPVPFDPALKGGDEIHYDALCTKTRKAYQEAAAAVATAMRDTIKIS